MFLMICSRMERSAHLWSKYAVLLNLHLDDLPCRSSFKAVLREVKAGSRNFMANWDLLRWIQKNSLVFLLQLAFSFERETLLWSHRTEAFQKPCLSVLTNAHSLTPCSVQVNASSTQRSPPTQASRWPHLINYLFLALVLDSVSCFNLLDLVLFQ